MAMYDPTGILGLVNQIEGALELIIDQEAIDQVKATLDENARKVAASSFKNLHVPPGSFGDSAAARRLGTHHLMAQEVIRDTLEGLVKDLKGFHAGIEHAEALIQNADEGAQADLDRKRAAAILTDAAASDHAGQRNHEARNHYVPRSHAEGGANS